MKKMNLFVPIALVLGFAFALGEEMNPKSGSVNVGKAKIYYEEMGEGMPFVMIHGGLLDRSMWDAQFSAFAPSHRVVRYDARGHGLSRAPSGTFSHHEDLKELLDEIKVGKAVIMGLSLGGYIAIDFALAYPERVSALILAAPGLTGYELASEPVKKHTELMNKAFLDNDIKMAIEYFQRAWTDGPARTPEKVNPDVREKVRQMAFASIKSINLESREIRLEPPAIDRLAEIQVPTLAVVGDLDMPDILAIVDLIEKNVNGAQKVVIKGVAHMLNMEKSGEFNRIVQDFLSGL
jgi:pimeloyl-ACP methyl ester carboxylesterase